MPAKPLSVNLLEHDEFAESPIGRIVTWATTYGRYIMITTEIVVLLAFISRFSLDRKLTDLNQSINEKQAIIEANQPFEDDVNRIQKQLARIKSLTQNQTKLVENLDLLKSLMPPGVYLNSLSLSGASITADVIAGSSESFGLFMDNLEQTSQFLSIDIGDINKIPLRGITFHLTVALQAPPPVQTAPAVSQGSNPGY
jgi:Tfp pilus assembly protein PilN